MQFIANHDGGYVGIHGPKGFMLLSEPDADRHIDSVAELIAPEPLLVEHRMNPISMTLDNIDELPQFGVIVMVTVTVEGGVVRHQAIDGVIPDRAPQRRPSSRPPAMGMSQVSP